MKVLYKEKENGESLKLSHGNLDLTFKDCGREGPKTNHCTVITESYWGTCTVILMLDFSYSLQRAVVVI